MITATAGLRSWTERIAIGAVGCLLIVSITASAASDTSRTLFPLNEVRITDGPFFHAQQVNVRYLLAMDPDRLLAPYLKEAGLKPKAESYGNWENSGLDGHIGGHYLSALSLAWAATGQPALKERLDYMIAQLRKAQTINKGYLAGIPKGKQAWEQIRSGEIKADLFSLNDRWVPLYNIDKVYHGLRDAYEFGGNQQAREMLIELGDWMISVTEKLSDDQVQHMLYSEHGGLASVFVDIARISGDARYLALAKRFAHLSIITPLLEKRDALTGLHANTQIPKIIGMEKIAEASGNTAWEEGAAFFWKTVTQNRSVSIGGNSVREHFHDTADFTPMVEDVEGPETCNTYNMLKLSKLLYLRTGDARYLNFYERATYNHILSSQHPDHGGLVYFTSMRPGHYRMYSSVEDSMWCCVGSGIENHSKYGELIYAAMGDDLEVNLFVPSTLEWPEKGITIDQQTLFPDENTVSIRVGIDQSVDEKNFAIRIRNPNWDSDVLKVKVNGRGEPVATKEGFTVLQRRWRDGDRVTFSLSPALYTEKLPDGQDYYSILFGPVVLSTKIQNPTDDKLHFVADDSRMGHVASGALCPTEALPVMLGDPSKFLKSLAREPGPLAFTAASHVGYADSEGAKPRPPVELIPFFRLHDSRYQIYWPQLQPAQFKSYVADLKASAQAAAVLAAMTVDEIIPGQQQPEVEHRFAGEDTHAGINNGHHWRDAGGWFGYQLDNSEQKATRLRVRYFRGDQGRSFTIRINGEILAVVQLPVATADADFYEVDYKLTPEMQQAKILQLKFTAGPGSIAGGIYGIRLLTDE